MPSSETNVAFCFDIAMRSICFWFRLLFTTYYFGLHPLIVLDNSYSSFWVESIWTTLTRQFDLLNHFSHLILVRSAPCLFAPFHLNAGTIEVPSSYKHVFPAWDHPPLTSLLRAGTTLFLPPQQNSCGHHVTILLRSQRNSCDHHNIPAASTNVLCSRQYSCRHEHQNSCGRKLTRIRVHRQIFLLFCFVLFVCTVCLLVCLFVHGFCFCVLFSILVYILVFSFM